MTDIHPQSIITDKALLDLEKGSQWPILPFTSGAILLIRWNRKLDCTHMSDDGDVVFERQATTEGSWTEKKGRETLHRTPEGVSSLDEVPKAWNKQENSGLQSFFGFFNRSKSKGRMMERQRDRIVPYLSVYVSAEALCPSSHRMYSPIGCLNYAQRMRSCTLWNSKSGWWPKVE